MLKQLAHMEAARPNGVTGALRDRWLTIMLAIITATAVAVVALPALLPVAAGTTSSLTHEAFSHITRSSALTAYVLIWASMLAGLSITGKTARKFPGMSWSFGLHRYMTLLGLGFAAVHALSLFGDQF